MLGMDEARDVGRLRAHVQSVSDLADAGARGGTSGLPHLAEVVRGVEPGGEPLWHGRRDRATFLIARVWPERVSTGGSRELPTVNSDHWFTVRKHAKSDG